MNREDCWMTFIEALEQYLEARDAINNSKPGQNMDEAHSQMQDAREHLEALTNDR